MRFEKLRRVLGLVAAMSFAAALAGEAKAEGAPPSVEALSPPDGARDACVDTPLRLRFDRPVRAGRAGVVEVRRADGTLFDRIDLADPASSTRQIGGAELRGRPYLWNYHPVLVDDRTATIVLHQALDYGQAYTVSMTTGVIEGADGATIPALPGAGGWRFTTRPTGPAEGTDRLTVARDGSGDFCTVQGAIDFVPRGNARRVFIRVRPGTYDEIVYVRPDKPLLTLYGEDRETTIIRYPNNNNFNAGNFRVMFGVDAPDFTLTEITLHNTTPYRGSQAEAFRSGSRRVLLHRVDLKSFQDTMFIQGQAMVDACRVDGDVDFLWGSGSVVFRDCTLRMVHPKGYYTQVRNPEGVPGYIFLNCRLTRSSVDITGAFLSRIDPNVFPYSQVLYLNCAMGPHIAPEGWLLNNANEAPHVDFGEYRSTDLDGRPLDVSRRAPFSRQLTEAEARRWSDPAAALGGWSPDLTAMLPTVITRGRRP